jgi:signal transduction histidine kinase
MALQDDRRANAAQAERLHKFAHDLRNRLAGLQQVIQHLGAHATTDESKELYEFGMQQQFKAMRETEVLLDDLGVDRSVGTLERQAVELLPTILKAQQQLQHRFTRKEQQVTVAVNDRLSVSADAHYLGEIITVLLSNASKFSPTGASIHVRAALLGEQVDIAVVDPGVGLSAEDLPQLFVRYAWLSSRSTGGEPQGRSSLARARQWAEAMDGTLIATSAGPGQGTVFNLRLRTA